MHRLLVLALLTLTACPNSPPQHRSERDATASPTSPAPKRGDEPTDVSKQAPETDDPTPRTGGRLPMPTTGTPHPDDGRHQLVMVETRRIEVGGQPLRVHVVDRPNSRRLGLMHVRELPEDEGMLFVYPRPQDMSFWMRNTYIPLSIAYIESDGRIRDILDMAPHDEGSHPSTGAVRFALEVNQGWYERHGVAEGDRVEGLRGLRGW